MTPESDSSKPGYLTPGDDGPTTTNSNDLKKSNVYKPDFDTQKFPHSKPAPPSPSASDSSPLPSFSRLLNHLLAILHTYILPPHLREAILRTTLAHPVLTSFLFCQFVFSCVPVGLLFVGALVSASVAVVLFTSVALLILGPVMVATTVMGTVVWGTAWGCFLVGRWCLEAYLGKKIL